MIEHMFDHRRPDYETIPSNLGDLQPGPELGGVLACIDVDRVSPYDRVIVLEAHQRQASYHAAEKYRAMTSIVEAMDIDDHRAAAECAAAEIGTALHLTRRATDRELSIALDLHQRLPRVWLALAEGRIDECRAKVFADHTLHLSIGAAQSIVDRIIDHAPTLTTGQLRARIDRLALEADGDHARARYETAVQHRRIVAEANRDGTGNLVAANVAPHRIQAALSHVDRLARSLKTGDETRTMDQLRADVLLDLLQGKIEGGVGGLVHLHADLDTLAALSQHPGELAGYGPVVADVARQIADELEDGEWRFRITDVAGGVIATGVTKRRPSSHQRRFLETRNPTCVFPGCRMPSTDCDIDHRIAWIDGGRTIDCNLAPVCRFHHRIKHQAEWRYRPIGRHDYLWTTRLGHTYTTSGQPP
jgi:Domain of unknown function (DUF222)